MTKMTLMPLLLNGTMRFKGGELPLFIIAMGRTRRILYEEDQM